MNPTDWPILFLLALAGALAACTTWALAIRAADTADAYALGRMHGINTAYAGIETLLLHPGDTPQHLTTTRT